MQRIKKKKLYQINTQTKREKKGNFHDKVYVDQKHDRLSKSFSILFFLRTKTKKNEQSFHNKKKEKHKLI